MNGDDCRHLKVNKNTIRLSVSEIFLSSDSKYLLTCFFSSLAFHLILDLTVLLRRAFVKD